MRDDNCFFIFHSFQRVKFWLVGGGGWGIRMNVVFVKIRFNDNIEMHTGNISVDKCMKFTLGVYVSMENCMKCTHRVFQKLSMTAA